MKQSCIRTEVLISAVIHLRAGKEKTWQYTWTGDQIFKSK
jgi:hypothetical protein